MRAEIVKISSEKPETSLIRYAADQIRAGEVLGMPTDTFYGLAADPFNLRAVDRVYEIKTRSRHKPLSLLIESVDQAEEFAQRAQARLQLLPPHDPQFRRNRERVARDAEREHLILEWDLGYDEGE